MGRDPREQIVGGIYHVMNRGNRKMPIFEDDRDRRMFIRILIEEQKRYSIDLHAGCQMGNHFHLVVGTPHANLSDFMEQLEGQYARYSNWRYGRVGHLFQGRFRHVVISSDIHLLIALCYVFLNPVSARLVTRPEGYRWSTYAATVGLAALPKFISIDWLETLFPADCLEDSQRLFRQAIAASAPIEAYLRHDLTPVDPEAVRRVLRSYTGAQLQLASLPSTYRTALRAPLADLVQTGMAPMQRAVAIRVAHLEHGYTQAEIAQELHLSLAAVSKIYRSTISSK